jgi:Na+-transporting methylmalonyl-CoA/oxaloacetate decarboxylase gamma subunit
LINKKQKAQTLGMGVVATILSLLMLSGCTAMLVGADVAPAEQSDREEDEKSRKER